MKATGEQKERSRAQALEGVQEETEEVERRQPRADTSTNVAAAIVVLYGLYGFFNGIRSWVDRATWLAAFGPPDTERSLSGLLSEVAWSVVIYLVLGFFLGVIALSLLDSTQRRLRRLGVKQAGRLMPLILVCLSGVIGALSGVQYWVTSSLAMGQTLGSNLLALIFDIVGDVALFGPIMFVGAMVIWWVVVALWTRLRG